MANPTIRATMSRFTTSPVRGSRDPLPVGQRWPHRRGVRTHRAKGVARREDLRLHLHPAVLALRRQPLVESRRDGSIRAGLFAGRACREMIRVLVLRMLLVSTHPLPAHAMRARGFYGLHPQLEVENGTVLFLPAA